MKKINKSIFLLTSTMLLACGGDKGLPKQKAITGDKALTIAQSIGDSTELREVLPPDEFYAYMTYCVEEISKDSSGTKSTKSVSTLVFSYSKKLQRFYMSESVIETSVGLETNGLYEQWFEPTDKENEMHLYFASTDAGKVTKQHSIMDAGCSFETFVQENFAKEANLEAFGAFESFYYADEFELKEDETYKAYYGSDNEQSLQIEEKYTSKSEYENESVTYVNDYLKHTKAYLFDLIVLYAHYVYDDFDVSKDGSESVRFIQKADYVLEKSSKKMPKLNKSEFKTIS